MRKSSRGNPWHDERGRFCDGPREGGSRSERTPEEYEQRTKERMSVSAEKEKDDKVLRETYVRAIRSGEYDEWEKVSDYYVDTYGYDAYREIRDKAIDDTYEDEEASKALAEEEKMAVTREYASEMSEPKEQMPWESDPYYSKQKNGHLMWLIDHPNHKFNNQDLIMNIKKIQSMSDFGASKEARQAEFKRMIKRYDLTEYEGTRLLGEEFLK